MKVSAIVACGKNGAIGKDNQIPWYMPKDLRFFKQTTLNHHILMGRKTFESFNRPLPNRVNIIITRKENYQPDGTHVFNQILEGVEFAKKQGEKELFVIGGGEIYRQTLSICHEIYYTEIDVEVEDANAFFPKLDEDNWKLVHEEPHNKDEKNPYNFTFKTYERIKPVTLMALNE